MIQQGSKTAAYTAHQGGETSALHNLHHLHVQHVLIVTSQQMLPIVEAAEDQRNISSASCTPSESDGIMTIFSTI